MQRVLSSSRFSSLVMAMLASCCVLTSHAQQGRAKVLQAVPIYERVATPVEDCLDYARHTRCTTASHHEEQLLGYDVLYEYQGQRHMQRMAHDPGPYVTVEHSAATGAYGSGSSKSISSATPGRKSYGSAAPGTPVVNSIEYHGQQLHELPVQIHVMPDMQQPHRPRH